LYTRLNPGVIRMLGAQTPVFPGPPNPPDPPDGGAGRTIRVNPGVAGGINPQPLPPGPPDSGTQVLRPSALSSSGWLAAMLDPGVAAWLPAGGTPLTP
jgi:hypothetical protein